MRATALVRERAMTGSTDYDQARADWSTRMAWSMTVAVLLHAAALATWGRISLPLGANGAAVNPEAVAGQPEWIFMDEAFSLGLDGSGTAAGPDASTPVSPSRSLTGDVGEADPSVRDALRDHLVGATSFAPTISGFDGSGGVPVIEGIATATGSGSSAASLSGADQMALQGLGELDLARLSAVRPDVALEALSYWVLVRNPAAVLEFMRTNKTTPDQVTGGTGAVSIALWVSAEGAVEWAEVITSSGKPAWDHLALELFSQVVLFRPARLEGIAMPISAIFTVNFPWL